MDNTQKFNGKGEIYAKARSSYAEELFDYLKHTVKLAEGSVFADIGSGTGIFSEQLLNSGYRVYGVEPNDDMRKKAEEGLAKYGNFVSVNGTDSNTTLLTGSVDCVTAAQAFHWFEPDSFKGECRRILKPDGRVIIVYNVRSESAVCNRALADIHRRYCPDFQGFSKGMSDAECRRFFNGDCEVFSADNSRKYDRSGYIARALSSSYSLHEGDEKYEEYLAAMNELFDSFSENGFLTVPISTVAYIGKLK